MRDFDMLATRIGRGGSGVRLSSLHPGCLVTGGAVDSSDSLDLDQRPCPS